MSLLSTTELDEQFSTPDDGVIQAVSRLTGPFVVIGAGGKMGFHICRMLQRSLQALGRDDQVTAVSRFGDPSARQSFEQAGLQVVAADASDESQVRQLPNAENVLYLAGIKFGTKDRPDLLHRMNVLMPQLVAERYRESRILAMSTGCVYSFVAPDSGGSTEESPLEPPGEYAQSCVGREQAFVTASERWRTRCSLIRLNYSIDLRYGVLVDLAQKVLSGQPVDVSMGYANVIWQRDAVSHILQALPHAAAPPFVLNVTGPETLSVRELAKELAHRFETPLSIVGEEAPTAWLNNASRAHQLFGLPSTSVEEMLDRTADWLTNGGETLGKPTHFQTRDGDY